MVRPDAGSNLYNHLTDRRAGIVGMETKGYTLKQAADAIGVTKQTIRYHLQRMGETVQQDERGQTVISAEVFEKIREKVGSKEGVNNKSFTGKESVKGEPSTGKEAVKRGVYTGKGVVNEETSTGKETVLALAVAALREQLEAKDAQIAEKDRQIEQLTEALSTAQHTIESAQRSLEASQALHAATMKQLQEQQSIVVPIIQDEPAPEPERSVTEEEPEEKPRFIPDDEDDEDEDDDPPVRKKRSFFGWLLGRE